MKENTSTPTPKGGSSDVIEKDKPTRAAGEGTGVGSEEFLRRQKALGDFGDFVLDHDALEEILEEGCRLVAEALGADLAKVMEIEPTNDTALVRAGVGWNDGIVGKKRVSLSERSSEAFAIAQGKPVITQDIGQETRFHFPDFLKDHGVVALVNTPIFLPGRKPWGVLQVDAREPREFKWEDIEFLRTYSMVLGPVIDRLQHVVRRQESEAKFRTLFESIEEALAIVEMIYAEDGEITDMIFRQVNDAYARQTGIDDAVGRSIYDIVPGVEDYWIDIYKKVATTGQPARMEQYQQDMDMWFDVHFTRVDDEGRFVAIVFNDTTASKRADAQLRESEERQAFLLRFSDALRSEPNEHAIIDRALRMLAEQLRLDRCYATLLFPEEDRADVLGEFRQASLTPMPSTLRNSDFPEAAAQTFHKTLVFDDTANDPNLTDADKRSLAAMNFAALLSSPLRYATGYPFFALGAVSSEPRHWTSNEVTLIEEATERTWAAVERARAEAALRGSEKRQKLLLELSDAYREHPDEASIGATCVNMLARHLGVDRCYIAEMREDLGKALIASEFYKDGLAPIAGWHSLDDYPESLRPFRSGLPMIFTNVVNDQRFSASEKQMLDGIGFGAFMSTPLYRGAGNSIFSITLGGAAPREWTSEDLQLVQDVTERTWAAIERARAEAALRQSEEKYAAVFAASPAPFVVLSPDAPHFTIADVNDAYLAATMRVRESIVGRPMFDAFPDNPEDPTANGVSNLRASLERALVSRRFELMDVQKYDIVRPDGTFEERWWKPANAPVLDANGNVVAIIHHAADVTAEHRAADALRASEERLRSFGEASQDVLWIRNADTLQYEYVSPAFETIYGAHLEELLSQNDLRLWAELIDPGYRERTLGNLRRVRAGERVTHEFCIRRGTDGEIRWIRDTDFPLFDEQGRVQRLAGIGRDITKERRAQDALRESEEQLRLIVENARDYAIFTTDPEGNCTDWREGAEAVFGYSREEIIEQDADILFTPEDRKNGAPETERATAAKSGKASDVRWHLRKDGRRVFIDGISTALHTSDGELIGFLKIGQDVTKRHAAEQALRESERHANLLLAELQHRVRNTLGVIRSIARRTAENSISVDEMLAHFQGRLDAFSRVQAALTRNAAGTVDLASLIEDEMIAHAARDGEQVSIDGPEIELEPKNAERLSLAIHELTTNAVKHGAFVNATGKVRIRWSREQSDGGSVLHLSWSESGVTIDPFDTRGTGFGMELLQRSLPHDLQASTSVEFRPTGLHFELSMPLKANRAGG